MSNLKIPRGDAVEPTRPGAETSPRFGSSTVVDPKVGAGTDGRSKLADWRA
jgi:hypothetical protein